MVLSMKLTNLGSLVHRTRHVDLRHNFAIGPLCDSYLFKRAGAALLLHALPLELSGFK